MEERPEPIGQWWNWWQAPLELIASVIIVLALAFLFSVVFPPNNGVSDDQFNIGVFIIDIVLLGLVVWRAQSRRILSVDLWTGWPHVSSQAWLLLTAFAVIWTILSERLQMALFPDDIAKDVNQWVGSLEGRTWFLSVFGAIISAPLFEEVVFRRILLVGWMRTRLGFLGASFLSSVFWSTLHFYSPSTTVLLFFDGMFLCLLARAVRSIWPGIIVHAAFNLNASYSGLLYLSGQ
jgi:uncharacterized protein